VALETFFADSGKFPNPDYPSSSTDYYCLTSSCQAYGTSDYTSLSSTTPDLIQQYKLDIGNTDAIQIGSALFQGILYQCTYPGDPDDPYLNDTSECLGATLYYPVYGNNCGHGEIVEEISGGINSYCFITFGQKRPYHSVPLDGVCVYPDDCEIGIQCLAGTCQISGAVVPIGGQCNNDWECGTNVCINGTCQVLTPPGDGGDSGGSGGSGGDIVSDCGNNVCESGETSDTCSSDCYCGNEVCDVGEYSWTCNQDCPGPTNSPEAADMCDESITEYGCGYYCGNEHFCEETCGYGCHGETNEGDSNCTIVPSPSCELPEESESGYGYSGNSVYTRVLGNIMSAINNITRLFVK